MVLLSILIPSVPERFRYLQRVYTNLVNQTNGKPVEILVMLENKKRTTGAKRNALIEQAQGEYVVFVDDDDELEHDYISEIYSCIQRNPGVDCIVFDVAVYSNNVFNRICKYGKEYSHSHDTQFFYRKPNHLMCFSKKLALQHKFKDISLGEDTDWANEIAPFIKSQIRINKVLYKYKYVKKPRSWYA
ncbi:glycosyltransferase family A protein [Neobacillus mesonae]|uniref:glycosyltransferase family A protein n=1 Tax=Neobacillus mesonae TaxID=1193713 RepID=UPI00203A9B10|nr:glycosyltransferase family A protein [Neobacillus mesonae]MCM3568566.1 glycosyltransferase family 2 protein [Neobacillus mesonae]